MDSRAVVATTKKLLHVGSVIVAPKLQSPGLVAQPHMGSAWTWDQSRLLHWQADFFLPLNHQGSPHHIFFVSQSLWVRSLSRA